MPTVHEHFSQQFQKWEVRGRGWQVFDQPVYPEPPFTPFAYRSMMETPAVDDGRRHTFLSALMEKMSQKLGPPPPPKVELQPEEEPEPTPLERNSLVEFQASLPKKLDVSQNAFEQFLLNLSLCQEPIAFELIGQHKQVTAQFATSSVDAPLVRRQLQAYYPEALFIPVENNLENA